MSNHTREPWSFEQKKVLNGYEFNIQSTDKLLIGKLYGSTNPMWDFVPGAREGQQNAHRIVSCVNACHGLREDELADGLVPVKNYIMARDQRDELAKLITDLLDQGQFFLTAVEAKESWESDFESWEKRARLALEISPSNPKSE